MGNAVLLRRFIGRARADQNAHGNGQQSVHPPHDQFQSVVKSMMSDHKKIDIILRM